MTSKLVGNDLSLVERLRKMEGMGDYQLAALVNHSHQSIRHRPSFRLSANGKVFDVHPKYLKKIQGADGYAYA